MPVTESPPKVSQDFLTPTISPDSLQFLWGGNVAGGISLDEESSFKSLHNYLIDERRPIFGEA